MDVVQPTQGMAIDSGDQTIITEKRTVAEASQKIRGSGYDSRDRKKSKYLSYPYTTSGPRQKDLPAQSEEVKTPSLAKKVKVPSSGTNPSNGSASFAKLGSKRFRSNWHRKFISRSRISSSPELINASPKELLSGLHSIAVDCMLPTEHKTFEVVEWFFSRQRISTFHDEAELATSLVDEKGGKSGKRAGSNLLDIKSGKKSKNNKVETAVKRKTKSLSGLSDMKIDTSTGGALRSGKELEQKRKVEEVSSSHQLQNGEVNLYESRIKDSSVTEAPNNLSCLNFKEKARPRKRVKTKAAHDPQIASVYTDVKGTKCSSLVIDLRVSAPRPGVRLEKSKEELVLKGSNSELCVPREGLAGNTANHSLLVGTASEVGTVSREGPIGNIRDHNFFVNPASEGGTISQEGLAGNNSNHRLLVSTTSEVGTVAVNKTELESRVEKPSEEPQHTKQVTELPDLNGICTESDLSRKEVEAFKVLTPEFRFGQSRSLSACSKPFKTLNNDRPETNGESSGTFLHLQFAPGASIPSKDELLTTFFRFGPLKASETQLFKETSFAQIVFVRSIDAGEALHSLEKSKPFGTALVDYKLHHLPAACPSVERLVTPTQPTRPKPMPVSSPSPMPMHVPVPMPMPMQMPLASPTPVPVPGPILVQMPMPLSGEAPLPVPSLEYMKQNLQRMTSTLKISGNNLSPEMKAKLETEINNLLSKVNSRAKSQQ